MEHTVEGLRDLHDFGGHLGDCHVGWKSKPIRVGRPSAALRRLLHSAIRQRQLLEVHPEALLTLGNQTRQLRFQSR